jgi:hypothetical protein
VLIAVVVVVGVGVAVVVWQSTFVELYIPRNIIPYLVK